MSSKSQKIKNTLTITQSKVKTGALATFSSAKSFGEVTFNKTSYAVNKISSYIASDACENDLDTVIKWLHIHRPSKMPSFKLNMNRNSRVVEKGEYVIDQVGKFITLSGLAGASAGTYIFGPTGATIGMVIGMGLGILVVLFIGSRMVVKRYESIADCPAEYLPAT